MFDVAWVQQLFPNLTAVTKLGEGGQKSVYAVTHPQDGSVVLKLVKPTQDPERVRREVRAVQQLQSARVPRVLDAGTISTAAGDCIWLREQRIQGDSLRAIIGGGALAKDL